MASEIVTEEMVRELKRRLHEGQPSRRLSVAEVRDALLAVAPLIRRAALEEAAQIYDRRAGANAREAQWGSPDGKEYTGFPDGPAKPLNRAAERYLAAAFDASELRALAEKQP